MTWNTLTFGFTTKDLNVINTEDHHLFPKSIWDNNAVFLTGRLGLNRDAESNLVTLPFDSRDGLIYDVAVHRSHILRVRPEVLCGRR